MAGKSLKISIPKYSTYASKASSNERSATVRLFPTRYPVPLAAATCDESKAIIFGV